MSKVLKATASVKSIKDKKTKQNKRPHNAKHNDRSEENKRKHIDYSKSHNNIYYRANSIGKLHKVKQENAKFYEQELEFYEQHFRKDLDAINANYIARRKYKQVQTMEQYMNSNNREITEIMFAIGDKDYKDSGYHSDLERRNNLEKTVKKTIRDIRKQVPSFTVLNWHIHTDEDGVEHAGVSFVLIDKSDPERYKIAKEKALENDGIPLPNPKRKKSKFNSRTQVFSDIVRDTFEKNVEELVKDITLDKSRDSEIKQGLTIEQYKKLKDKERELNEKLEEVEKLEEREKKLKEREEALELKQEEYSLKERSLQQQEEDLKKRSDEYEHFKARSEAQILKREELVGKNLEDAEKYLKMSNMTYEGSLSATQIAVMQETEFKKGVSIYDYVNEETAKRQELKRKRIDFLNKIRSEKKYEAEKTEIGSEIDYDF